MFRLSLARLSVAWVILVLALLAVHVVLPQASGTLALTEVFEPYLVLTGLIAVPFALMRRTRASILVVSALLIATTARYGPAWVSFPSGGPPRLTVATWNVLGGPDTARRTLDGVLASNADLIALVELQPAAADALSSASSLKSRLPYQVLAPDPGFLGTGLLSRYPVLEQKWSTDPSYLRAVVDVPGLSKPLVVYVVHPLPAITQTAFDLPVGLDTSERDRSLALIHAAVAADVAADQTVLAAGDFNTTEREPAYSLFVRGMRDAHLDAGIGPGLTWRPSELEELPFGLIRIDYLLTTPDLQAVSTHVVCGSLSDHCLLEAALR